MNVREHLSCRAAAERGQVLAMGEYNSKNGLF